MKMLKPFVLPVVAAMLLVTGVASATTPPFLTGLTLTLSNTPVSLPVPGSGSTFVQRVTVRVIPGFACKVYVGSYGLDRYSYSGVYAVLYPNSAGGWSEEWTLEDPRGYDGIDVSKIYVSGDCAGDQITVFYFQTNTLSYSTMHLLSNGLGSYMAGLITPSAGRTNHFWIGTVAVLEVRVVPGFTGKMRVRNGGDTDVAVLYPNTGNPNQSSARSERFTLKDSQNRLNPSMLGLAADVGGEGALVTGWTF